MNLSPLFNQGTCPRGYRYQTREPVPVVTRGYPSVSVLICNLISQFPAGGDLLQCGAPLAVILPGHARCQLFHACGQLPPAAAGIEEDESDAANVRDKYPITSDICELLPLDPFADVTIYGGKRFNAILIYYLTDYLKECKQKITKFLDEKASEARDKLLGFYNDTRGDITVCQFEAYIMSFLKDYAALLETNIVKQNVKGPSVDQHN